VQELRLSRFRNAVNPQTINVVMEDVQVDGKKWTPFKEAERRKKFGGVGK
jgi:hypothetical protein